MLTAVQQVYSSPSIDCSSNASDFYSRGAGSNLSRDTDYPDCFPGFFSPPGKFRDNTLNEATTTSFHIISNYSLSFIHSFIH
jgi:hypothetical protein